MIRIWWIRKCHDLVSDYIQLQQAHSSDLNRRQEFINSDSMGLCHMRGKNFFFEPPKKSENSIWKLKTTEVFKYTPNDDESPLLRSAEATSTHIVKATAPNSHCMDTRAEAAWRHWIEAWRWFESFVVKGKRPDKIWNCFFSQNLVNCKTDILSSTCEEA